MINFSTFLKSAGFLSHPISSNTNFTSDPIQKNSYEVSITDGGKNVEIEKHQLGKPEPVSRIKRSRPRNIPEAYDLLATIGYYDMAKVPDYHALNRAYHEYRKQPWKEAVLVPSAKK